MRPSKRASLRLPNAYSGWRCVGRGRDRYDSQAQGVAVGFWGYIRRARQHFTVRWEGENTAIMRSVVQPDALEAALEESLKLWGWQGTNALGQ